MTVAARTYAGYSEEPTVTVPAFSPYIFTSDRTSRSSAAAYASRHCSAASRHLAGALGIASGHLALLRCASTTFRSLEGGRRPLKSKAFTTAS